MVLFEGIRGLFGGLVPTVRAGFPKTLTKSDFSLAGGSSQSLVAGTWNIIGTFVVPAQQKFRWGYGKPENPDNQGYIYIDLKDTSATPQQIEGMIRLVYADASLLRRRIVFEERTNVLRGSTTDRRLMKPLPEQYNDLRPDGWASEDDRLLIEIRPDSSQTLSFANSTVFLPATQIA